MDTKKNWGKQKTIKKREIDRKKTNRIFRREKQLYKSKIDQAKKKKISPVEKKNYRLENDWSARLTYVRVFEHFLRCWERTIKCKSSSHDLKNKAQLFHFIKHFGLQAKIKFEFSYSFNQM